MLLFDKGEGEEDVGKKKENHEPSESLAEEERAQEVERRESRRRQLSRAGAGQHTELRFHESKSCMLTTASRVP